MVYPPIPSPFPHVAALTVEGKGANANATKLTANSQVKTVRVLAEWEKRPTQHIRYGFSVNNETRQVGFALLIPIATRYERQFLMSMTLYLRKVCRLDSLDLGDNILYENGV